MQEATYVDGKSLEPVIGDELTIIKHRWGPSFVAMGGVGVDPDQVERMYREELDRIHDDPDHPGDSHAGWEYGEGGPAMTETHDRLAQEYYPSMSGKTDWPSKEVREETPKPTKDVGGGQGGGSAISRRRTTKRRTTKRRTTKRRTTKRRTTRRRTKRRTQRKGRKKRSIRRKRSYRRSN